MTINDILNNNGIQISTDEYFVEYLIENKKNKIFYIDTLPEVVPRKNIEKYNQYEMIYQEVLYEGLDRKRFISQETRFIDIFRKLWLYNDVYVKIDSLIIDKNRIKDYIEPCDIKLMSKINYSLSKNDFIEVTDIQDMDFFVRLGTRNVAFLNIYLRDYNILFVSNWSCFWLCLFNKEYYSNLKKFVDSEGLFLRGIT